MALFDIFVLTVTHIMHMTNALLLVGFFDILVCILAFVKSIPHSSNFKYYL